jgi:hypothetical protein
VGGHPKLRAREVCTDKKHAPEDLEDLESLIFLGKKEQEIQPPEDKQSNLNLRDALLGGLGLNGLAARVSAD